MNPSQIPGPLVASMLASMAAIGLWRAPITTFVTLGSGAAGYWLGIQKIVSVKSPRTWLVNDLPPDPLASDFDLLQLRQEIRETATTIAGLRQEFATTKTQYSGELSNLSSRLNPLESSTSKASSQLQTLHNNFQELNQRLSQELRQLNGQLMPNGRSLTRLETELINIQQKLAAATLELSAKDDGLNQRIEPIETEIRRLRMIMATPGNTTMVASSLEAQLSARLTAIEAQLVALASKPEVQALKIDTHSLTEAFQRLDADLRSLTQRVSDLVIPEAVDLSFLEASVSQLGEDSLQVQQTLEELQHGLHILQTTGLSVEKALDIKVLYARTEDLQHHLDNLQQTLAATQSQYSSDFAALSSRIHPVELDDGEIRRELDRVHADLGKLSRQLNQTVQHLATQPHTQEQALSQLATDLLGLQQHLTQLSETQRNYGERLSQLEPLTPDVNHLLERVNQLTQEITNASAAMPDADLAPLEMAISQLQQHLVDLTTQFDQQLHAVGLTLQDFRTTQQDQGERLAQVATLADELNSLRNSIEQLSETLTVDASEVNLEPLETALAQLQHQLADRVSQADRDRETVTAQLHALNTTQLSYDERLSQLEPLAHELNNLRAQIQHVQQTSAEPVNLEPLETTLAQLQHQLGELASQADRDHKTVTHQVQQLSETYQRLDIDLRTLNSQLSDLTQPTSAAVDLTFLTKSIEQLRNDLTELRLDSKAIATAISKPIKDNSIDTRVLYGRSEALQQKMDALKKRFQDVTGSPKPILLWRDQPAPQKRRLKRPPEDRVAIFVDGANLVKGAQDYGIPLDTTTDAENLVNFLDKIKGSHNVYFHGFEINSEVGTTLKAIKLLGYKVIKREGKASRAVKANMDGYITLEMLQYLQEFDTAVLVSGDGDFVPTVQWLRSQGKRVEVMGIRNTVARSLMEAADNYDFVEVP